MPATRLLITGALIAACTFLSGCQTASAGKTDLASAIKPSEKSAEVYLRLYDKPSELGSVTLVAKDVSLVKAIKQACPDCAILSDPGVNMDRTVNVWADSVSRAAFLDQLADRTDLSISENAQGDIVVRSSEQWQFNLPAVDASLMSQARRIAEQAGLNTIVMGEDKGTLLVSGKPSQLRSVQGSLNQLSDRIQLSRILKR